MRYNRMTEILKIVAQGILIHLRGQIFVVKFFSKLNFKSPSKKSKVIIRIFVEKLFYEKSSVHVGDPLYFSNSWMRIYCLCFGQVTGFKNSGSYNMSQRTHSYMVKRLRVEALQSHMICPFIELNHCSSSIFTVYFETCDRTGIWNMYAI